MKYMIMITSLLLDGILSNYLPFLPEGLSLFTPLLTLMSIILIYPFYKWERKQYFITIFILGIIYDLLYTNLFLANAIFFLSIGILINKLEKRIKLNKISIVFYAIFSIFVYELLIVLSIMIFNLVPITLSRVIYKITHSLLLNVIYVVIIFFLLSTSNKKYKKRLNH